MKVGLELHTLIKSLTIGENSAVRRNLPPKKDEFYEVFRNMETYDSKQVRAQLKGMSDANIATTAHQLIDLILKLLYLSVPKHGMRDLVQGIGKVEILIRKGLFSLAHSKVEELIRLSQDLDAMSELITALKLKKEIDDVLKHAAPEDAKDIALAKIAVAGIEERSRFEDLHTKILTLKNTPAERKELILADIEVMIQQLPPPQLKRNKARFHYCKYMVFYARGQYAEATNEAACMVGVLDDYPALFADVQLRIEYFACLHYLVLVQAENGFLTKAHELLAQMEQVAIRLTSSVAADPMLYGRVTHATIFLLMTARDWDAVKVKVRQVIKDLGQPGSPIVFVAKPIWLRMTLLAAFCIKDYKSVRKLAYDLRTHLSAAYMGSAFVCSIAIFHLAALYEEKDEFLGQMVQTSRKWLDKFQCKGEYENLMLDFFAALSNEATPLGVAALLQALKERLVKLFENPILWQHREMFPVLQWIESQQNGEDLKKIMFP